MRLPRVQFTVRRIMVLIAFMALVSALAVQSMRVASRDRELRGSCCCWRTIGG